MKQTKQPGAASGKKQQAEPQVDWSQYGATGFERTSTDDLGIPFLIIVQKGSPEVDRTHKDFATKKIEGVEAGCIINTVTREILHQPEGDPVIIIPCAYERQYVEWKPRDQAGGFVRQHSNPAVLNECKRNEKNQDVLPSGNIVITTGYFVGLIKSREIWEKVIIAMTSTQLKKARLWLNMMMAIKSNGQPLPMFSHKYALNTIVEQNQQGSWFGWHIEGAGMNTDMKLITEASEVSKRTVGGTRPLLGAPTSAASDDDKIPM